MRPLANIKTLEHFSVVAPSNIGPSKVIRSILMSLSVDGSYRKWSDFVSDWDKLTTRNNASTRRKHQLTALKSLSLTSIALDETLVKSMDAAFDFTALHELSLGALSGDQGFF